MRQAFTMIELMVVMAIIAVVASIAIPNLLETRETSQESASAAALKTSILPAEVQFQAGAYCDFDGNGIGDYAVDGIIGNYNGGSTIAINPYNALTGYDTVGNNSVTLNLLPAAFMNGSTYVAGGLQSANFALYSQYYFKVPITQVAPVSPSNDNTAERTWGVLCYPKTDNDGRRFFMINQAGTIFQSSPSQNACTSSVQYVGGFASSVIDAKAFGSTLTANALSPTYVPYRR